MQEILHEVWQAAIMRLDKDLVVALPSSCTTAFTNPKNRRNNEKPENNLHSSNSWFGTQCPGVCWRHDYAGLYCATATATTVVIKHERGDSDRLGRYEHHRPCGTSFGSGLVFLETLQTAP
jgi:hypothetical protein